MAKTQRNRTLRPPRACHVGEEGWPANARTRAIADQPDSPSSKLDGVFASGAARASSSTSFTIHTSWMGSVRDLCATTTWLRTILSLMLLAAAAVPVRAEVVSVPDFTKYEIPQTQNPSPRPDWQEYLDVGALAAGLALASYFALVRRSRRGLFLLSIASLAWLGFWRKGCVCPIGAIQNVAVGVCDGSYTVPLAVVAFFTLPLVFTLFVGRTFCASVCPLGAVQELVAIRPIRTPVWLDHALGLLAYVYLGAAVLFAATGTAFVICRYDPFVGMFRLSSSASMLAVSAGFLLVGVFVGRPYCRYLCPYGAILGLASHVARWHVKIPPKDCIQCRLCEDSCPYGAIRTPTIVRPAAERHKGRRRLAALMALAPVLIGVGGWLGTELEAPLAKLHPTVQLADQLISEIPGQPAQATNAIEAFRNSGRPEAELYREARDVTRRLGAAGGWFGAWVGLVIGIKLIHLSIRRRRTDYQPDRANCVSCGRCFWYCPSEQSRHGWIEGITISGVSEHNRKMNL